LPWDSSATVPLPLIPHPKGAILTEFTNKQMPQTLDFTGNATTFLGLVGLFSTALIVFTSFRRFHNSPLRK